MAEKKTTRYDLEAEKIKEKIILLAEAVIRMM